MNIMHLKRLILSFAPFPVRVLWQEVRTSRQAPKTDSGEISDFHLTVIRPEILLRWRPTVIEIGVLGGAHTRLLLRACLRRFGKVISIDPETTADMAVVVHLFPRAELRRELSLDALPKLVDQRMKVDIAVIDGDHNYYTVSRELRLIEQMLAPTGVVFLHDVGWPYGRRDLYYDPDRIPASERHEYAMLGMARGTSELLKDGGKNGNFQNACYEGGPRNGVLTAVEDFMAESSGTWTLEIREEQYGLGILRRV
jgi:predicted O-methyltransferase YrrM